MKDTVVFLVVEDDNGHFELTKRCLRKAGFANEILWFVDGEELLSFLSGDGNARQAETEYVLLLDIQMPKVDGIETLGVVKGKSEFANMPVIMVTTSDAPVNIVRCRKLGCDGYVIKPLGDNLIEAVNGAFSNSY